MDKQILIDKTVRKIKLLPEAKIKEIDSYVDFLLSKIDNQIILEGIQKLTSESKSFDFLNDEEDLYNESDLKEKY